MPLICRVQSLFNALGDEVKGKALALGGDGRYYGLEAAQIIIKLAVRNSLPCICTASSYLGGRQGGIKTTALT